jgi:hypothetical protein
MHHGDSIIIYRTGEKSLESFFCFDTVSNNDVAIVVRSYWMILITNCCLVVLFHHILSLPL